MTDTTNILVTRKVAILKWETDIHLKRVVYTVQAYTKKGAAKKARRFLENNS